MKKKYMLILWMIFGLASLRAQNCPFEVKFTTKIGTCYNNAVAKYEILSDKSGLSDIR